MLEKTFIVVWEGVDGSGKTTLMNSVIARLNEIGETVVSYKTPSDSPTGVFAQTYGNSKDIDPFTRMLLFLANTSADSHVIRKIVAQKKPDFLFIDRYNLCSTVYGFALLSKDSRKPGLSDQFKQFLSMIELLGESVFVKPDLTVIVSVDPETRSKRVSSKPSSVDSALEKDEALQRLVEQYYDVYAAWRPEKVVKVTNSDNMLNMLSAELAEKVSQLRREALHG